MLEGQIKAKVGFYDRIIYRIKNRHIVQTCNDSGFREISIDEKEIEKIQSCLYDLSESMAELLTDGYEDFDNMQDDIQFMIEDLQSYTGITKG